MTEDGHRRTENAQFLASRLSGLKKDVVALVPPEP
jgi:hypothetical protein